MAHAARSPKDAYSERKNFATEVRISKMNRRGLDVVAGSIEVFYIIRWRGIGRGGVRWTRPVNGGEVKTSPSSAPNPSPPTSSVFRA